MGWDSLSHDPGCHNTQDPFSLNCSSQFTEPEILLHRQDSLHDYRGSHHQGTLVVGRPARLTAPRGKSEAKTNFDIFQVFLLTDNWFPSCTFNHLPVFCFFFLLHLIEKKTFQSGSFLNERCAKLETWKLDWCLLVDLFLRLKFGFVQSQLVVSPWIYGNSSMYFHLKTSLKFLRNE